MSSDRGGIGQPSSMSNYQGYYNMRKYTESAKRTGRMQRAPQSLCAGQGDNLDPKRLAFCLERICQQWISGQSIHIVQNPEASADAKALPRKPGDELLRARSQMVEMASEAVKTVRTTIADPRGAYRLLQDLGVVSSLTQAESCGILANTPEDLMKQYRQMVATQIGLIALERNEVFGTELPVAEPELERRLKEAGIHKPQAKD
jgi:hypothetical protein